MNAVAEKPLLTPEDLLALKNEKDYELVDGHLLRRKMSTLSGWVGTDLARVIGNHVADRQLGWVFGPENGYRCFIDRPKTVRRPDISFVRTGRITWDQITDGWLGIVPDLVVEVISPNDLAYEVDEKMEMFHRAGVPLIWIVSPVVRTVRVVRVDGSTAILREGDRLSGEDVVPGVACPVDSIFPPRSPATPVGAQPTA